MGVDALCHEQTRIAAPESLYIKCFATASVANTCCAHNLFDFFSGLEQVQEHMVRLENDNR
jgi:hypothetical protein